MTTVVSNGYYLIADKRLTHTNPRRAIDPDTNALSTLTAIFDDEVKLFSGENVRYTVNDVKVMAFGLAGDITEAERFMFAANDGCLLDFCSRYTKLMALKSEKNEFGVLCLMEDHTSVLIEFTHQARDLFADVVYTASLSEPGMPLCIGSGASGFKQIFRNGLFDELALMGAHPLNIFLAMASLDIHSSTSYDAYSLEEDKLVTGLVPEEEAVLASLEEFSSVFKFRYRPK